MRSEKMLVTLVLSLVVSLAQMASAAQSLTMNIEAVDEITLETGQICLVHIVSDNSNPYSAYVGFDDRVVLGTFGPTGVYPEAGDLASITEYDIPAFYGYFASAAGTSPPPSPGNHFGITYQPQQVGETELKLYDPLRLTVIAKVRITVVSAQMGTVFTYQGRLLEAGDPADGQYDFEFKLYNAPSYGVQLASTIKANDLDVINGYFTVALDFGSDVFNGDACWLDISVRPGDSTSNFTSLGPRQRITSTPYSLQTRGIFVDNAGNVGMGTTSPGQELHVYQPIRNVYVRAESDGGYAFFQADGTENSGLRIEENGTLKANVYWNTASQCLSLAYGNDDSLVVKGENVGIGTKNPARNLHIYRDSGPAQLGIVTADTSTKAQIIFGDGGGNKWTISSDNADENKLHFRSGHASGTPRVTFQQDGKVGIGTTSPQADMDVRHSPGSHRIMKATASDGSELFYVAEHDALGNGFLGIKDGTVTTKVFITADGPSYFAGGNVAIGKTYPQARLDVDGDLKVSGAYKGDIGPDNGAPFPRPAYDSGWVLIAPNDEATLNHNIGGNVDKYVVDMQFKNIAGIHNYHIGSDSYNGSFTGAHYKSLTTSSITVRRSQNDSGADQIRIRIWVYN